MRLVFVMAMMVAVAAGAMAVNVPLPEAGRACIQCPAVPVPSDCPPCYEWVPQTCRQCAHCEHIKGCHV